MVVKEMETSSYMHISQEYEKISSTTRAFQRGQGWGSATHVLLLKKEGIDQKGYKEVCWQNGIFKINVSHEN